MRPITVLCGPYAAASATSVAASATPVSGTPFTLVASPVVLDTPRRILVTFGNEASNRTLVLTGTNWSGNTITETIAVASGASGTAISVLDYATLVSALPLGGGWTAAMSLGTSAATTAGSSAWVRIDDYGFAPVDLQIEVTGTINWTVEGSDDDPNLVVPQTAAVLSAMVWLCPDSTNLSSKTATAHDSLATSPMWLRLTANSYTTTGHAVMTVKQPGGKWG